MEPILEITHVSKTYGKKEALKDVSLKIEPGKVVGLLGPNGSGKSTLIKLINGLLQPTDGQILVAGQALGIETKKMISYLPERTYLNEWMKVKDLLGFFSDFYEDFDIEKARQMLATLKIDEDSKLKTLSKGTKEKVQLILVMSRKAKLYVLDEPIGGVDPAARDYILNTIIKNYSEESSVIIATHLIQEVENICDDIIFLGYGEVRLQGNVDDIRQEKGQSIDALFREVFRC
ncbi:ABC transporter ATP-binding protein [Zhenhengia yiwuensis]|uniref:ABC transporter ATP-binding protein n=2 Tax=Zhenhengia TaxID=2944196 RepID=A0A926ELR7_9FIRM|nr:ABC transporter ATP-binding protein [Zhenhengia yiwuensis]MBC8580647.1 ABC transporter ATP-binding protein [Zhenhengia yiwuensis]MBS5799447.1 ABC transporter ATP-binding protein [Clostridiales bacterium]